MKKNIHNPIPFWPYYWLSNEKSFGTDSAIWGSIGFVRKISTNLETGGVRYYSCGHVRKLVIRKPNKNRVLTIIIPIENEKNHRARLEEIKNLFRCPWRVNRPITRCPVIIRTRRFPSFGWRAEKTVFI